MKYITNISNDRYRLSYSFATHGFLFAKIPGTRREKAAGASFREEQELRAFKRGSSVETRAGCKLHFVRPASSGSAGFNHSLLDQDFVSGPHSIPSGTSRTSR